VFNLGLDLGLNFVVVIVVVASSSKSLPAPAPAAVPFFPDDDFFLLLLSTSLPLFFFLSPSVMARSPLASDAVAAPDPSESLSLGDPESDCDA